MMRIRQTPLRANRKPTQHQYNRSQKDGHDLEVYMQLVGVSTRRVVEARNEYGSRDDAQEGDGGHDTVSQDQTVIFRQASEAIAHTVVLHCRKVEALQVG
jgi:hypothetical protein